MDWFHSNKLLAKETHSVVFCMFFCAGLRKTNQHNEVFNNVNVLRNWISHGTGAKMKCPTFPALKFMFVF